MRETVRAFGYVLHARPYRETSLLLELLLQGHGRVGVVARGVRGGRTSARRALLQPLQPLSVELLRRGELAQLVQVEAASAGLSLRGDALLAAFYVNELCVRLLPRDAPADGLFADYALVLARLESGGPVASVLRHFEWALLELLGEAPDIGVDLGGAPIEADAAYLLRHGIGAQRVPIGTARSLSGAAVRALAAAGPLPEADLAALRGALRGLIEPLLGARPLRSWGLIGELQANTRGDAAEPPAV